MVQHIMEIVGEDFPFIEIPLLFVLVFMVEEKEEIQTLNYWAFGHSSCGPGSWVFSAYQ
jgi:hypothetical protein